MSRRSCFWPCASPWPPPPCWSSFAAPRQMVEPSAQSAAGRSAGGALAGLFLFSGYAFQTIGLQFTTAPKSAFLTGLTAVMTPLLAALVYRTRPRGAEIGGVLLATCGMALMTLPALPGATLAMNRGDLLTICCAACYAAHILTLSRYSARGQLRVVGRGPDRRLGAAGMVAFSYHGNAPHPLDCRACGRPSSSPVCSPPRWLLPSRLGRNDTRHPRAPR